jgi:hypothetical protein
MKTAGISITIGILFTSCFGLWDNDLDTIVGDYEIGWIDLEETRTISKGESLIPAFIFAVGHDKKFIYAQQHPVYSDSSTKINQTITNYYIIERTNNSFQDKPVYGPLTKKQFDSLSAELRISPDFDLTYPKNF